MMAEAVTVRKEVVVDTPIERAFAVFTGRFGDFKPAEVSAKNGIYWERLRVVSCRVMLGVPGELIWSASRLLAARRRHIGTRKGT
jgi:hypothetical protein